MGKRSFKFKVYFVLSSLVIPTVLCAESSKHQSSKNFPEQPSYPEITDKEQQELDARKANIRLQKDAAKSVETAGVRGIVDEVMASADPKRAQDLINAFAKNQENAGKMGKQHPSLRELYDKLHGERVNLTRSLRPGIDSRVDQVSKLQLAEAKAVDLLITQKQAQLEKARDNGQTDSYKAIQSELDFLKTQREFFQEINGMK